MTKIEDKKSILTVNVSVKDTNIFKTVLDIFKGVITDERIDKEVRKEYVDKLLDISR